MLSKSQAKLFFIVGTICFSGVFLFLTYDTLKQVPKQTNSENITPEVDRGKKIWENNNCMGCHTLFGEGAYYAPELTKVYDRRGEAWMRIFLRDPEAMFPGERKMTNYHFTEDEISDVIAFLKWCGEVDLNGFPADPPLAAAMGSANATTTATTESNVPNIFSQLCTACHTVGGNGGTIGPALDGVASRLDEATIYKQIKDPHALNPDSKMPNLGLSDDDINSIVNYLKTLN